MDFRVILENLFVIHDFGEMDIIPLICLPIPKTDFVRRTAVCRSEIEKLTPPL